MYGMQHQAQLLHFRLSISGWAGFMLEPPGDFHTADADPQLLLMAQ
jgi:hypothetical protein